MQPEGVIGVLGLTFCPGKIQRGALTGDWERDLALDLQAIKDWGATATLNLLEDHELHELRLSDLGHMVSDAGLDYYRFPIPDGGVPGPDVEESWIRIGQELRQRLENGEKILVHCKGGLGRTGMMAGRLLVELGADPETAIRQVRSARPGAIETRAQEAYVRRQRPVPREDPVPVWHSASQAEDAIRDRFLGCMLGGAVGDALGAAVEFMSREEIVNRFGARGITDYVPVYGRCGAITDDTQMTLFTAEGLIRGWVRLCMRGITTYVGVTGHAYLRWLMTQGEKPACDVYPEKRGWLLEQPELHNRRAPGNTCLSALRQAENFGAVAVNDSKGCGGVMRVAPAGLFGWHWHPEQPVEETFNLSCELAALTHGHPTGQLAAGVLAVLVLGLTDGATLEEVVRTAKACLAKHVGHEETLRAIEQAEALAAGVTQPVEAIEKLGQGWVAEEALAIALYCALVADTFEEGIVLAVNHGGDSDSTGAITGNLLGALHGTDAIPKHWLEDLELRAVIAEIAGDLFAMRQWRIGEYVESSDSERILSKYPGV